MNDRLILWDFDGTLADTLSLMLSVYNETADEFGFRRVDDVEAVRDLGMRDFIREHGIPTWRVPQLFARNLRTSRERMGSVPLFAGITDMLTQLRSAGYRHSIVSSNSTDNIQRCLDFNGAVDLFDDVCGTGRLTGKERRIRTAMKQFEVSEDQCLYVGDEIRDVEAARAAGLEIGCVAWGLNSPGILQERGPVFVATAPEQLPALIGQHFCGLDSS